MNKTRLKLSRKLLPFLNASHRYKVIYGGRASGKSWGVAICLLIKAINDKLLIVCAREYQRNLEESVYRLLCNTIRNDAGLSGHYTIMSDKIKGRNGSEFVFTGIKNAKNFKSFEGADILWVEESQSISAESVMVIIPTIRKHGSELWFTFNPDSEDDPVYDLISNPRDDQLTLRINYTDNQFVSEEILNEALHMKKYNYELYKHVWLGECRVASDAQIYKDKYEIQDFILEDYFGIPRFNGQVMDMRYGLDFGWVHPCAVVETFRYEGNIYVWSEIVGQDMDLDDITIRILEEMPMASSRLIYADSATPLLISSLKQSRYSKHGVQLPALMIEGAVKGAGSVETGITWLKTHKKIIVHPRCVMTINNLKKYSYKKTKDDIITTQRLDLNDDCLDALRYAYNDLIKSGGFFDWGNVDLRDFEI
jgi:phage terminase large subunit